MNPILGALTLGISLSFVATPLMAIGVFAIVDEVRLEPSEYSPERIWISGVFVVPVPHSSGHYQPPRPGHLYFSLNPEMPEATRSDWKALEEAAETGQVVGFGRYWVPRTYPEHGVVNSALEVQVHADRGAAVPEPYPTPADNGILKTFDTGQDPCQNLVSSEIIASLRTAYSQYGAYDLQENGVRDVPACSLITASDLPSAHAKQARNPTWAQAAEAAILNQLAQATGLEVLDFLVDCRETICRLRLVFPTEEYERTSGMSLVSKALNEMPPFSTSGLILTHDGTPTLEYYLQHVPATQSTSAESTN